MNLVPAALPKKSTRTLVSWWVPLIQRIRPGAQITTAARLAPICILVRKSAVEPRRRALLHRLSTPHGIRVVVVQPAQSPDLRRRDGVTLSGAVTARPITSFPKRSRIASSVGPT